MLQVLQSGNPSEGLVKNYVWYKACQTRKEDVQYYGARCVFSICLWPSSLRNYLLRLYCKLYYVPAIKRYPRKEQVYFVHLIFCGSDTLLGALFKLYLCSIGRVLGEKTYVA